MKNLNNAEVHQYRNRRVEIAMTGGVGDDGNGCFSVPITSATRPTVHLNVIAANGMGWDHVSVSHKTRTPKWDEMEKIKRMFFEDDETVMQLHVPIANHINVHDHCLHLWRPQDDVIPAPPGIMV